MRLKIHRDNKSRAKSSYGGMFRKGTPKTRKGQGENAKTVPGKNTDYFRLDPASERIGSLYSEMFEQGGPAKEIPIRLAYDDMFRSWETYREEFTPGHGFVHRCDGEFCSSHILPNGRIHNYLPGMMERGESKPCPYFGKAEKEKGCKPRGEFTFYICDFPIDVSFRMKLTSINDIETITQELEAIEERYGNPARIPLILFRTHKIINKKMKGKAILAPEFLLSVRVHDDYANKQKLLAGVSASQARPVINVFEAAPLQASSSRREEEITYKTNQRYVDFQKYIFELVFEKPMKEWHATLNAAEAFALKLVQDGLIPNPKFATNAIYEDVAIARSRYQTLMESHRDSETPYPRPQEPQSVDVVDDSEATPVDVHVESEADSDG